MKHGHRPGATTRQPGDGLQGLLWADWMTDALCRRRNRNGNLLYSLDLWFPDAAKNFKWAKAVCDVCPVRAACLQWALNTEAKAPGARWGMYGGLTPDERAALAKETA